MPDAAATAHGSQNHMQTFCLMQLRRLERVIATQISFHSPLPRARTHTHAHISSRYLGWSGAFVGVDTFGASAPAPKLYEKFGITKEAVLAAAKKVMA